MQVEIEKFKIRCSSIGSIMAQSRGKSKSDKLADLSNSIADIQAKIDSAKEGSKTLKNLLNKYKKTQEEIKELKKLPDSTISEGAKTYCKSWLKSQMIGSQNYTKTKYTDKGIYVEYEAFKYLKKVLDWNEFTELNKSPASNEFIKGTCDVKLVDSIQDIKCPWTFDTHPILEDELPEKDYEWQLRGYMPIYKKESSGVIYTFMDTPEHILFDEARRALGQEYRKEDYERFAKNHIASHLPDYLRIKRFAFERDKSIEDNIYNVVTECRKFILSVCDYKKIKVAESGGKWILTIPTQIEL